MKSKLSNITVQNCRTDVVYEISANDPDFETKFQRNNLNRLIAKNHVSEIRSSITDSSWEMFSPIEVNINTWNVIDGQHRLDAFSTLSDDIKKNAYLRVIFYKLMLINHTDGSQLRCREVEWWREVCGRTNQMEVKK